MITCTYSFVGDLNALHAKCAAWSGSGRFVVTSSNQEWVPVVPFINDRHPIHPREDATWGEHEYSYWPQFLNDGILYHACIPRHPGLSKENIIYPDRSSVVWHDATWDDWAPVGTAERSVYGTIRTDLVNNLMFAFEHARAKALKGVSENDKFYHQLRAIIQDGVMSSMRMKEPADMKTAYFSFREVQRITLEIVGYDNYARELRPRIQLSSSTSFADRLLPYRGVITTDSAVAQNLYRYGMPVWFV